MASDPIEERLRKRIAHVFNNSSLLLEAADAIEALRQRVVEVEEREDGYLKLLEMHRDVDEIADAGQKRRERLGLTDTALEARVAELEQKRDACEIVESMAVPQWQFSLHRLLTGEWQASFVDDADSRSGHVVRDTMIQAIRDAQKKALRAHEPPECGEGESDVKL